MELFLYKVGLYSVFALSVLSFLGQWQIRSRACPGLCVHLAHPRLLPGPQSQHVWSSNREATLRSTCPRLYHPRVTCGLQSCCGLCLHFPRTSRNRLRSRCTSNLTADGHGPSQTPKNAPAGREESHEGPQLRGHERSWCTA